MDRELVWNRIRSPSEIKYLRKWVEQQGCNGFEGPFIGKDGYWCMRLGYQGDDLGEVTWKAAIWIQIPEIRDLVEQKVRAALHVWPRQDETANQG